MSSTISSMMASPSATLKPALKPPPGVESNFANPESLKSKNDIAMAVSITLTTILYFMRCYARIIIKKQWIVEDCENVISPYLVYS